MLHVLPTSSTRFTPTLTEDAAKKQARLLQALADPTRLQIINLLSRYEGNMNVFELVACFNLTQPTLSHHLRILRDVGLIDSRQSGLYRYYHLIPDRLQEAQRIIAEVIQ